MVGFGFHHSQNKVSSEKYTETGVLTVSEVGLNHGIEPISRYK